MQSDRWIEKGVFRSKTKSCILTQSKKFFKPTASLATPDNTRSLHTAPYSSSDSGLTATAAAAAAAAAHNESTWHILFSAGQQARTVIRWQQSVLSMTFFATPLLLPCSLWRLSTSCNATTAAMKGMSALCAPNEHIARGKGATKTWA